MAKIMYGSQTYPWQMNAGAFAGNVPHMVRTLKQAGFTGMEAEIVMLGGYYRDWEKLKDLLDREGIAFAALAVHEDWLLEKETDQEKERLDEAIEFLSHFPTAKLVLCHVAADPVREHLLYEKQKNQLSCLSDIAMRARERGIVPVYHPNSGENSIFRYESDYHIMFDTLYTSGIGYAPDAGHLANGGIDPLQMIMEHRDLVQHVHFKDMTAGHEWTTMGTGVIDFPSIVRFLEDTGYGGWIMTEDESPDAAADSDGVVMADGIYMRSIRDALHEDQGQDA